jgi:methyl-accepting chemotaxis protein
MKRTLLSIGIGAGLMYLFDPELGEIRRSMLRDRLSGLSGRMPKTSEAIHDKAEALAAQADDLTTRVDEAAAEVITNVVPGGENGTGTDGDEAKGTSSRDG